MPEGAGHLYAQVISFDPPAGYGTRGFLRGGIVLEQWMNLQEDGDETILKSSTLCFGEISDEMAKGIRHHGDLANFEDSFRSYVER